jgi:hypothetical protein
LVAVTASFYGCNMISEAISPIIMLIWEATCKQFNASMAIVAQKVFFTPFSLHNLDSSVNMLSFPFLPTVSLDDAGAHCYLLLILLLQTGSLCILLNFGGILYVLC